MYAHSYGETIEQCRMQAKRGGGWRGWLYKGFVWQAVRQVPSTSAGLIMFELARRRFGEGREVRIEYEEYDIHLS